jgi:hypothetical protein
LPLPKKPRFCGNLAKRNNKMQNSQQAQAAASVAEIAEELAFLRYEKSRDFAARMAVRSKAAIAARDANETEQTIVFALEEYWLFVRAVKACNQARKAWFVAADAANA